MFNSVPGCWFNLIRRAPSEQRLQARVVRRNARKDGRVSRLMSRPISKRASGHLWGAMNGRISTLPPGPMRSRRRSFRRRRPLLMPMPSALWLRHHQVFFPICRLAPSRALGLRSETSMCRPRCWSVLALFWSGLLLVVAVVHRPPAIRPEWFRTGWSKTPRSSST